MSEITLSSAAQIKDSETRRTLPSRVLLEFEAVTKRFPGVVAVDRASLAFSSGTIHALLGENGAGKSTLVKVLGGIYTPDEGNLLLDGTPVRFHSPHESERAGIAVVHQHRTLVNELSVLENIFLGRLGRQLAPFRHKTWQKRALELLEQVGLTVELDTPVGELGPAAQQMVEIARALGREARLIVFDEPTTSLTPPEREFLFKLVRKLRARGMAVVYISHDLEDTLRLSDEVTVLRDGGVVAHESARVGVDTIVHHMIGRTIDQNYPRSRVTDSKVVLAADDVRSAALQRARVSVRRGEIVCIAGLVGSGRTELLRTLYGLDPMQSGRIRFKGKQHRPKSPRDSICHGIGMVTEDRKQQGLVLEMSVASNITLGNEPATGRFGVMSRRKERSRVASTIASMKVKTSSPEVNVVNLSGGNQQKVVLGRWLARKTDLLLIDEPTVGIDVGARSEFYRLLDDYAAAGGACIVVSSDLSEVLGLADNTFVMRDGETVAEIAGNEATRESLLRAMTVETT